ncbi:MAG: NUDIX hydrolase [Betaproteobacteria bacterium]|nr:NUDIX hydrolase [Betaproteobacteria bacterium]
MTIRPWPLLASERIFDAGLFEVTRDLARSPRTLQERRFCVVHMVDWLTVVPLTKDGRLVLVRQYRHGSREASLELPGGLHEPGQDPQEGATRELAEETGYGGGAWSRLGELRPQPALLSNRVHVYLAKGVRATGEPRPDAGEDIEVVLIEPSAARSRIAAGEMSNAMTIAALGLAQFAGHL